MGSNSTHNQEVGLTDWQWESLSQGRDSQNEQIRQNDPKKLIGDQSLRAGHCYVISTELWKFKEGEVTAPCLSLQRVW